MPKDKSNIIMDEEIKSLKVFIYCSADNWKSEEGQVIVPQVKVQQNRFV